MGRQRKRPPGAARPRRHRGGGRRGERAPPLDRPGRAVPGPADDRARRDHRQRRPAVNPARPALHPAEPDLGDERLPDHVRRLPAARRPDGRPGGPEEGFPRRPGAVHGGVDAVRCVGQSDDADRRAPAAGHRRGDRVERDPRDHRHRVSRRGRAGARDGRVRVRLRGRRLDRPARRGRAHAVAQLALDLLRQRPRRGARVCARVGADR